MEELIHNTTIAHEEDGVHLRCIHYLDDPQNIFLGKKVKTKKCTNIFLGKSPTSEEIDEAIAHHAALFNLEIYVPTEEK